MKDMFYYPIGIVLLKRSVDLSQWYFFQLGFKGFDDIATEGRALMLTVFGIGGGLLF